MTVEELSVLLEEMRGKGVQLAFTYVHLPVKNVLASTGFLEKLGEDHLLATRREAIAHLFRNLDHGYCRDVCPHRLYQECSTVK